MTSNLTSNLKSQWLGWHFLTSESRPGHGEHGVAVPGQTLRVQGPLVPCHWGLHASSKALDALQYAPGPIACRVRLSGDLIEEEDKAVATERVILWMGDAARLLHFFALWTAERALQRERDAGREPDPRSWAALTAKQRWLSGEIPGHELEAAMWEARAAAREAQEAARAAQAAQPPAAQEAAQEAAQAALWAAAQEAIWASREAAQAAAREALWAAAAQEAAQGAARAALWAAAQAAREATQAEANTRLEEMLMGLGMPHERES